MDPVQMYETTIYNRDRDQGFAFVTMPARSLESVEVPPVEVVASRIGLGFVERGEEPIGWRTVEPVEAWSLPFMLDATMGRRGGPESFRAWRFDFDAPPLRRGPSAFAQYLAYAPVVPFESSPLSAKALSDLVTASGGVGAAVGSYATGEPLVLLAVPAGIIVCGAARGVADALRIGLRAKLLGLMGVEDPDRPPLEWFEEGDESEEGE